METARDADRVLRDYPDFRRFWLADAISNVGSGISIVALPLTALTLGAELWQFGMLTAAGLLPLLLLSLPAGVLVDRSSNPLRLLLAADIIRGLLLLTIPLAASLGQLSIRCCSP